MEKVLSDLEAAATLLMAPPNAVSSEERHKAEHCFLEFRKMKNPYEMCRAILEKSKNDYVLFEAMTTIKFAIIREWALLNKHLVDNLCEFLLCFATENTGLQNYVREQMLQVVAIIFKLGTLENPDARTKLIGKLSQLLQTGNKTMELVSCSIMKALLTEFSTSNQSTNFGMSLDFHSKCKRSFEEKDLLNSFVLTVEILQKYMNSSLASLSRQDIAIFVRYLSLAEQILHWEFMADVHWLALAKFSLTCSLNNETAKKIIFRPPKSWRNILLQSNLLQLFFQLFEVTQSHSELSHYTMQCLQQLASVAGSVFASDDVQTKYLYNYLENFFSTLSNSEAFIRSCTGHQSLGISNILYRLADVFPVKIIVKLPSQTFSSLLEAMTFFTCLFQEKAIQVNSDDLGDNEFSEASSHLLDAWMLLISHHEDYPPSCFTPHAIKIVNTYLKVHLSPPDGFRKILKGEEIDCDIETENDRCLYDDELCNISQLGRQCLENFLPIINEKFELRINALAQVYVLQKEGKSVGENEKLDSLYEDIHWLVMIASYLISDDNPGESPQISNELISFMNVFLHSHPQCIKPTVVHLLSFAKETLQIDLVDPVIRLFVNVLRLVEIEMEYLHHQGMMAFSPELASTLLWFFKRFVSGYLSFNESSHIKQCPTLLACFDPEKDNGKFVLKYLLGVVELNLCSWSSEPQTSNDTVSLLLRLVEDKSRALACLEYPTLWNISKMFSSNHKYIVSLGAKTQRQLAEALMRACDIVSDVTTKMEFRKVLLEPIVEMYKKVRSKENFKNIAHDSNIKQVILRTLDCITGFAPACFGASANEVFSCIQTVLEDTVNLLEIYNQDTVMIVAVLQMFVVIVDEWLCAMETVKAAPLCGICLNLLHKYSAFNLGRKVLGCYEEEEQYEDILLLIKLLSHILARDFLSFDKDSDTLKTNPNDITTQPVECVIFGLQSIIPLISKELMKYPNLCNEYFKLVTFVCEIYPEKIARLPDKIFANFMVSIELAISEYGGDVGKCGLEALSSMAKFYANECDHDDVINKPLADALNKFLSLVFRNIVLASSNVDLIESASVCLFMLICSSKDEYLQLANQLIAQQEANDPHFKDVLVKSFEMLTPPTLQLTPNRQSLKVFRKNLEVFLGNVKGFLCYK